jgi:hypothetical protein
VDLPRLTVVCSWGCRPRQGDGSVDEGRFDNLTRSLANRITRRSLAGLTAGALAALAEAGPLTQAGKKRKKPFCATKPLRRCLQPSASTFHSAVEACASSCRNPDSSACAACLEPAVSGMVAAASACRDRVCRGGLGPGARASGDVGNQQASSAAGCDSSALKQCRDDVNDDLKTCYMIAVPVCLRASPLGCAGAAIACGMQSKGPWERCNRPPVGCGDGKYCKNNVCCGHYNDTVCKGVCCAWNRCERCEGGVCKGCQKPASCGTKPGGGRTCACPSIAYHRCGNTCCSTRANEKCVDGRCRPEACDGKTCTAGETCCGTYYDRFCCPGVCMPAPGVDGPGLCCAPEAQVKCVGEHAHCAPAHYVCCGTYSCANCADCYASSTLRAQAS